MTIQYEDTYPKFTDLSFEQRVRQVQLIRIRRRSYVPPKKKTKSKASAKRQSPSDRAKTLAKNLTDAERKALIKELEK